MYKFILFLILAPLISFSQHDSIQKKVKRVIVYADCKNKQTNKALMSCFSKKLQHELETQIFYHDQGKLESYKIQEASATIKFIITKQGRIMNIEYLKVSHPVFKEIIENAFSATVSKLKEIEPAIDMDGNGVNLIFQFPVKYQFPKESLWENEIAAFQKFPQVREVVFAVLDSGDKIFEIRLNWDYQIKIYERTNIGYIFLGTFLDLYAIESIEPYQTIIKNAKISGKYIKADGMIGNKHYQVVYDLSDKEINVYENSNLVESYRTFSKFIKSPYAELILRK